MKRTRFFLVVSTVVLIAALVLIVNLSRGDELPTGLISPSPRPQTTDPAYLQDMIDALNDKIDSLDDKVDTLSDKINTLTEKNKALRDDLLQVTHFVDVKNLSGDIIIDQKYASDDNFTGKALYPVSVCLLRAETAQKLAAAEKKLKALGYHIVIWDAYRPLSTQQILYDATVEKMYIADPGNGSRHNRGAAVDLTLADAEGNEIEMPSGFDDFSVNAHRDNPDMSKTAQANLTVLTSAMVECGFTPIRSEWWHFDDSDWVMYPVVDVPLEDFVE